MSTTSVGKTLYCHYSNQDFRKGNLLSPRYWKYIINFVSMECPNYTELRLELFNAIVSFCMKARTWA